MNTITELLKDKWRSVDELPNLNYSFHCLIQFKEHGMNGEENKHISTGCYWHIDELLQIIDSEMEKLKLTPMFFFPLYEDVH